MPTYMLQNPTTYLPTFTRTPPPLFFFLSPPFPFRIKISGPVTFADYFCFRFLKSLCVFIIGNNNIEHYYCRERKAKETRLHSPKCGYKSCKIPCINSDNHIVVNHSMSKRKIHQLFKTVNAFEAVTGLKVLICVANPLDSGVFYLSNLNSEESIDQNHPDYHKAKTASLKCQRKYNSRTDCLPNWNRLNQSLCSIEKGITNLENSYRVTKQDIKEFDVRIGGVPPGKEYKFYNHLTRKQQNQNKKQEQQKETISEEINHLDQVPLPSSSEQPIPQVPLPLSSLDDSSLDDSNMDDSNLDDPIPQVPLPYSSVSPLDQSIPQVPPLPRPDSSVLLFSPRCKDLSDSSFSLPRPKNLIYKVPYPCDIQGQNYQRKRQRLN